MCPCLLSAASNIRFTLLLYEQQGNHRWAPGLLAVASMHVSSVICRGLHTTQVTSRDGNWPTFGMIMRWVGWRITKWRLRLYPVCAVQMQPGTGQVYSLVAISRIWAQNVIGATSVSTENKGAVDIAYCLPVDSIAMCWNNLYMFNMDREAVWGGCQHQPWRNDIILTPQVNQNLS